MDKRETGREQAPDEAALLFSLSPNSTLLIVLRALYSLILDYGVYLTDRGDALAFSKAQMEQMVLLGEQGQSETPIKDLPVLMEKGLFKPLVFNDTEGLENVSALVMDRRGARVTSLVKAINPNELDFPEWWEAPIPLALCGRGRLKLNPTALYMFGAELERLNAVSLPEKDEFIVELEGKGKPCFLAFSRLEPNVFTIDDCTGDLVEAQDISWWAAVGRTLTKDFEKQGKSWRRADSIPADFSGQAWPCEWQGRFLGYLCVENFTLADAVADSDSGSKTGKEQDKKKKTKKTLKAAKSRKRQRKSEPDEDEPEGTEVIARKDDEVLKALGPQTMALLAAGQGREDSFEPDFASEDEESAGKLRKGAGKGNR